MDNSVLAPVALIFFLLGLSTQVSATTDIFGGNVSGVWNAIGSPYVVHGDISILSADTLLVEAATVVQFSEFDLLGGGADPSRVEFIVNGNLEVLDASLLAQNGDSASWSGIEVEGGGDIRMSNAMLQGALAVNVGADFVVQLIDAVTFDHAEISGSITLGGNLMLDTSSFTAAPGDSFVLLENDGPDPMQGTFAALPEGSQLSLAGVDFVLSYAGGDGNDVELSSDSPDSDNDGVPDVADNCTATANAGQRDTDADSIGNACDPDVSVPNDCTVNFLDLNVYKTNFFAGGDLDTDNNGDGLTNFADLNVVKNFFFGPPGPSASGCN